MARGPAFQEEGFYHIYNRGTDKRVVFDVESDYERFIILLYLANSSKPLHINDSRGSTSGELLSLDRGDRLLVDICAYCLMPNHFHLLLRERVPSGISRFMHKLSTAYTMYFNTRYERTGALFQGRFKARDANDDQYLKYLIAYIHLNPVKLIDPTWKENGIVDSARTEKFLEEYSYSSYVDYCGNERTESLLLSPEALPDYFETPRDFKTHITDWFAYEEI